MAALFCWLSFDPAREVMRAEGNESGFNLVSNSAECARVAAIIEAPLRAMGLDLVRVASLAGSPRTIQIMIERTDGMPITLDVCAAASRSISALLDVADPIAGAYDLEVSSPGIERPLTRAKDFDRFAGHNARIVLKAPKDGRRRFQARLVGLVDGAHVRVASEETDWTFPLAAIEKAQLVADAADLAGRRPPSAS